MLNAEARALVQKLEKGSARHMWGRVPMDANAKKLLASRAEHKVGGERQALRKLLERDMLAFDAKTRRVVGTNTHMPVDLSVRPRDHSAVPGWTTVEQCMEFAMRYCRTVRGKLGLDGGFGKDWTLQYNMADELTNIAGGKLEKPGYQAYLNGGAVPPRAGDVITMQGPVPAPGNPRRFHVALVSDTYKRGKDWFTRVYEANVPWHVNDPDVMKHFSEIPLEVKNGKFQLQRVNTSAKGYGVDMDVVGWLHPQAEKALPGAVG